MVRARSPADTRFVFMLSNGRSGSTILGDMLSRHRDVGFVSNLDDRAPWLTRPWQQHNSAIFRRVPQRLTEKGRWARFAPSEGWRLLDSEVSPILSKAPRALSVADASPWLTARLRSFFSTRAAVQGRPVFLHKLTGWPHAGLLRAAFPAARFVHVVRDGRAVVDSDLRTSWWEGFGGPMALLGRPLPPEDDAVWLSSGRSHAVLAALVWRSVVKEAARMRDTLPDGVWIDVRYEDLLADRELVFKRLLDFTGLDPSSAFDASVRRTRLYPERRDAYRRNLSPETIAAIEQVAGDELADWGYL